MQGNKILFDLFDRNIVATITVLLDNPEEHFTLSQLAHLSGVPISTTSRIISRFIEREFVSMSLIGKTKHYQLQKGEKVLFLQTLMEGEKAKENFYGHKHSWIREKVG